MLSSSFHRVYTLSHRARIVPFPSVATERPARSHLLHHTHHSLIPRLKITKKHFSDWLPSDEKQDFSPGPMFADRENAVSPRR